MHGCNKLCILTSTASTEFVILIRQMSPSVSLATSKIEKFAADGHDGLLDRRQTPATADDAKP